MSEPTLSPDSSGYYGIFGGKFIPEILYTTFDELIKAFKDIKQDPDFWNKYWPNHERGRRILSHKLFKLIVVIRMFIQ